MPNKYKEYELNTVTMKVPRLVNALMKLAQAEFSTDDDKLSLGDSLIKYFEENDESFLEKARAGLEIEEAQKDPYKHVLTKDDE